MNGPPPRPREIEGKYALLIVLFLGLAGAGGGWWYHQRLQSRPLSLWGGEAAHLLLRAPEVELCRLEKTARAASAGNVIVTNGETYQLIDSKDASRLRGFLHLRHSLLNDHSFDWSAPATGKQNWRFLLRFHDGPKTATLLFSADFSYVQLAETGATASIRPIADGMEQVLGTTRDENPGRGSKVGGARTGDKGAAGLSPSSH